jgi:mannose-6-phosphate isomerase-like protein (cupin superfamily)
MVDQHGILELIDAPGRVALIRKAWEPTTILEATLRDPTRPPPAFGKVVGDRLEPPDMLNVALPPMQVIVGEGFLVEVAKRAARVPLWHRNLRADELVFAHRGRASCDAELGTTATGPGEAHLRPLGCLHRVVPDDSGQGTFNIIFESRVPWVFAPAAAERFVAAALDWPLDLKDSVYIDGVDADNYHVSLKRAVRPSAILAVEEPPPIAAPMQVGKVDVAALAREGPAEWDGAVAFVSSAAGLRIKAAVAARARDYWHRNLRCDELLIVHEGSVALRTEYGAVDLAPGDMAIVPRGVSHHLAPSADAEYLTLEVPQPLAWTAEALAAWEAAAPVAAAPATV